MHPERSIPDSSDMRECLAVILSFFALHSAIAQLQINYEAISDVAISPIGSINSPDMEFSPCYYEGSILYVTNAEGGKKDKEINERYFDLSSTDPEINQSLSAINDVDEHLGPAYYLATAKKLYYTQSKRKVKGRKKAANRIYSATMSESGMSYLEEVIVPEQYSAQHPTLSADGDMIIFSTDATPSIGAYDLMYATRGENGSWNTPKNLGPNINSPDNEAFPFLYQDSVLFFSSLGRGGYGGYDIYVSTYRDGSWQQAINLGSAINSSADDIGMIVAKDALSAYFSSNRAGGQGKDDIYFAQFDTEIITEISIADSELITIQTQRALYDLEVIVEDHEGEKISDAFVSLIPFSGDMKSSFDIEALDVSEDQSILLNIVPKAQGGNITKLSDDQGRSIFEINNQDEYFISVQREGFQPFTSFIDGAEMTPEVTIRIRQDETLPTPAEVITTTPVEEKEEPEIVAPNPVIETTAPVATPTPRNPVEEKILNAETLVFDQLYYDYGSTDISKSSLGQLDTLADFLLKYENANVELIAHTDSRGNQDYNLKLSVERAMSAKLYLVSKGVSDFRVKALGKGETELRNHCSSGVYCTEKEHEYNRRTEVRVYFD